MTIRTRFHVIFVIIAALMIALAVGAVSALSLSQSLVERVYRGALLPSLDLKRVADAYTGAAVVTAVRVRIGDLRWEEGEAAVRRAAEQAKPAWERYKANAHSETERALLRSAQENMVEANAAIDELIDILSAQDIAGLTAFIARAMYPSVNPLLMDIDRLTAQQDRIGEDTYDDAIAEVERYWINQTLLLAVAVAMFAAAFYTVRNRVVLPLHRMTGAMSAVAEGELDRPVPSSGRADEIGALARALVRFKDNAARLKEDQRTLRILADELSAARDKAEEATHAKSTFLAMMSHEIRTPMNGVTAMAEMLDRTDLGAEQRDMLGIIRSSGDALLVIINDILDFSKIEAGKLDIETIELALTDLVEGAAELVASRAAEKGLRYAVDLAPDLPDRLLGDPTRVRQILINLLGNAVKFTQSGVILLTVRDATPDGGDGTRRVLRFAVADTGIGLSEEQIQRLFRPFEQADGSTSRRYGGSGLGLSISSALCAMMGGRIGVTSELGRGSTFWFELPFDVVAPEPAAPVVPIADARIVAVGFVDEERAALRDLLAAAGIGRVTMAAYDEDWAGMAAGVGAGVGAGGPDDAPTVLILHAGGDGTETAQLVAAHLAGTIPAPPVLLAVPMPRPIPPPGVFATLPLPLRRRRVWRALAAALGRAPLEVHDAREASDLDGWEPPSRAEAEAANALILVAEDNPTNQVVIRRMLAQRGYAFDLANHGGEALALLRAGRYGLLLTDFHMPEMDGFELTAAIRAEEAGSGRRLPIVALTADALPGTGQRCQEAGMDAYLTKPIDSKALSTTLQRFLPQAAGLRRAVTPVATPTTDLATRAAGIDPWVFDPTRLIESFGRAEAEALAFLAAFVDAVPGMIVAIENALAAVELRAARDAAHSLKGAALSVGAVRLGQLAGDLQDALDDSDPDTAAFLCGLLPPTQDELVAATAALRAPTA